MKKQPLATRYRPQKFSEIVGQDMPKNALSRAAAEDRVAPAYLLSGTRGVGKTTIARIFAKALNCRNAPVAEPCNECQSCRQITSGIHVDVNEIDGASNTGVDDIRALRENAGYMPMEGRYRIYIIDEAHMLSKSAFNALLKTLEEPPPRAVFIMATTEAYRFPATILSRCLHFVFRNLSEDAIFKHICNILDSESIKYEETAARLIARRASGSVRDSLTLLDQVLSMCNGSLDAVSTREALGIVGQEFFQEFFLALAQGNHARILELSSQILGSGVDIGFFMRDLAASMRNMFLVAQNGANILPYLGTTEAEGKFLLAQSGAFTAAHLHAAWQMILENQRSITQSLEPGAALELLLLNLAMLPQLLPVDLALARAEKTGPKATPQPAKSVYPTAPEANRQKDSQPEKVWKIEESSPAAPVRNSENFNWQEFCDFCRQSQTDRQAGLPAAILLNTDAQWQADGLEISCPTAAQAERLQKNLQALQKALASWLGQTSPKIRIKTPAPGKTHEELLKEYAEKPEIQLCSKILGAQVSDFHEKTGQNPGE